MFEVVSLVVLWIIAPMWVLTSVCEFYASTTIYPQRGERFRRLIKPFTAVSSKFLALAAAPYFAVAVYHHYREGDRFQTFISAAWLILLSLGALGWLKKKFVDNRGTVGTPT